MSGPRPTSGHLNHTSKHGTHRHLAPPSPLNIASCAHTASMQEKQRTFPQRRVGQSQAGRQSEDANVRCARLIGKVWPTESPSMRTLLASQNFSTYLRVQIHSTASNLLIKSQTIVGRGHTPNAKLQLSASENTLLCTNCAAVLRGKTMRHERGPTASLPLSQVTGSKLIHQFVQVLVSHWVSAPTAPKVSLRKQQMALKQHLSAGGRHLKIYTASTFQLLIEGAKTMHKHA